jgi:hypothetical protein
MGISIPVTAFGICIELTFDPPLWVHAVTTLPMILILWHPAPTFPEQARGVASPYVNKAEEARFTMTEEAGLIAPARAAAPFCLS